MSKKRKDNALIIEYHTIGTISIDELADAIMEDIQALKNDYSVRFVTAVRLRLPVTNEYGEPLRVKRPGGGGMYRIDTHHYRLACLDYDL